ncbi:glutathione S-transferase family protein [Comamonas nitrativorans]|uniref:Glutathione S-transferase family protein n=1 Tax=Comamonas nitrativorans TaxID=108437 RepID=A0ABV9GV82_9BURK
MLQLLIGNKNYSSWSLRPWLALHGLGIAFEEVPLRFDGFGMDAQFKQRLRRFTPSGKVPVLVLDGVAVWDSLAIAETLAEAFPHAGVWPGAPAERAQARGLCADIHSGFTALRQHCPMNVGARLPAVGARVWQEQADLREDVHHLLERCASLLQDSSGPMLFGAFGMADAYLAPVWLRLQTYALPCAMPASVQAYVQRVLALPALQQWCADAAAENDFVPFLEPYRSGPTLPE